MTDEAPVEINSSIIAAQVRTALRYFFTVAGPFLPKLFSGLFTPEIQTVLQTDEFAGIVGAIIAAAMGAWGMADTYIHKKLLVAAANAAPNTKFIVTGADDKRTA